MYLALMSADCWAEPSIAPMGLQWAVQSALQLVTHLADCLVPLTAQLSAEQKAAQTDSPSVDRSVLLWAVMSAVRWADSLVQQMVAHWAERLALP